MPARRGLVAWASAVHAGFIHEGVKINPLMKTPRSTGSIALAIVLAAIASPVSAQVAHSGTANLTVAPPTPDADALAEQMRILAHDPKNADALIKAGELTLKLGDPTAAAVLFSRAEAVRPNDGQLKADEAAVLVHMERPGEALRLFQQAVAMGANPANFAAERGLAYDLIGEQERAQRDYRTALAQNPDDAETMRRYALSLGISGERDKALEEIDPLVRKQDHAGWRDRAFILAMTGDPDKASKIAHGMLPAAMANGLDPFFRRLPDLTPVNRAFAVHFGEIAPTPQRLADARLIPALPPLAREDHAREVAVARAQPAESRSERKAREKVERARQRQAQLAQRQAQVAQREQQQQLQFQLQRQSELAARGPADQSASNAHGASPPRQVASSGPVPAAPIVPSSSSAPPPPQPAPEKQAAAVIPPGPSRPAVAARPSAEPAVQPATRVGQEDDILKRIMAGINVPQAENQVETTPARPAPAPARAAAPAADSRSAGTTAPAAKAAAEAKRLEAANLAAAKKASEARAAAKAKAEAERKAAAAKKVAEEKKAADAKLAREKAAKEKEERANAARIWVQVAGGANARDLPKAWATVKGKAPDAFKGKQGWSTPLNATNRVLAGPFKSSESAQDFVNDLARKGVSAFLFTSAKGQKIDKLPAK